MAFYSDCGACASGNHAGHVEHWGRRAEGVVDGDFCMCLGDCADRAAAAFKRSWLGTKPQPDPVALRDLEWRDALSPFVNTLREAAERTADAELAAIFADTADELARILVALGVEP